MLLQPARVFEFLQDIFERDNQRKAGTDIEVSATQVTCQPFDS